MHDLVDIGVNLGHRQFGRDRDAVIRRALEAGVRRMIVTGTSVEATRSALALARGRPETLFATAGIHPHDSSRATPAALEEIAELARLPEVRAVGECGLDFDRDFSPRPAQEAAFEAQLELACDRKLPVFLHERAAHDRFLAILTRFRPRLVRAVVHCFTGGAHELDAYLAHDIHIGITGWICDDRRGAGLRPLVARIPADRLMIETDAPFLAPPGASRRNEPAFLTRVLEAVALAAGKPAAQVAQETTRTAEAFFGLPPPAGVYQ
ncbi:MAG: TatD family hydrolase [Planctomycetes bacterium]|nr:TatD family hydrolase [Planctomycetota bacterium]